MDTFNFPPEIEREIFEWAALCDPTKSLFALILVSKQVQRWIEPLNYRHIMFWEHNQDVPSRIISTAAKREHNFLAAAVRSICIYSVHYREDSDLSISELLKNCPNTRWLAMCGRPFSPRHPRPDLTDAVAAMNALNVLALPYTDSVELLVRARLSRFPGSLWGVTHLDIGVGPFPPEDILLQLPALKQLAYGPWDPRDQEDINLNTVPSLPNLHRFLQTRGSQLQLVWLIGSAWDETEFKALQTSPEYCDFLLVNEMPLTNDEWRASWDRAVRGSEAMFEAGEKALERRRLRRAQHESAESDPFNLETLWMDLEGREAL